MWGNLRGWLISAMMVLVTVGVLYTVLLPPGMSAPAGLVPLAFKPIAIPAITPGQTFDPATIVPGGTKDCDAGELYQQAIDDVAKDSAAYQELASKTTTPHGVDLVLQAAGCGRMHLFDQHLKQIINYDDHKPWIDALASLGQGTCDVGLRLRDSDAEQSRKYFEAAFQLGRRLYDERIAWPELAQGLSIMQTASTGLSELADRKGDGKRVDELNHFRDAVKHYEQTLQDQVASPLGNPVEQDYAHKYAGDIFDVARSDRADRIWRVEAILHIGRYRWNVASNKRGDQLAAPKELQKLEANPDPVLHAAVLQAESLTQMQQRMTASGS